MKGLSTEHRRFLDRLLTLERDLAPVEAPDDGLDDFRRLVMHKWDNLRWRLLGTTAARLRELSPAQHTLLQVLQDSPDLLLPLERDRDEVSHTRIVAWVLGLDGPVGDACRRALARQLDLGVDTELLGVHTEVAVAPGCRVDLVIETGRHLVYVEAKVDSGERPEQLADYRAALAANAGRKRKVLVFLTIDPPDQASAEHTPLSFARLLALWLPATLLPGPDARYLASYLVTVAGSLCEVLEPGPFATWSLGAQHRMLDLLHTIEEADVPGQ